MVVEEVMPVAHMLGHAERHPAEITNRTAAFRALGNFGHSHAMRGPIPRSGREVVMVAGFVFIKCELGQVESVANKIVEIDGVSEVYSISGNYDLLAKVYVDRYEDFPTVVPRWIHHLPGVRETSTLMTFNAFK
jgi:DNA-binding Lrp family transcriptional regulator